MPTKQKPKAEPETKRTDIALPHTGELVSTDDIVRCAKAVEELRVLENRVKAARRDLAHAVGEYTKVYGSKTMHLPGAVVKVSGGPGSGDLLWDVDELAKLLDVGLPNDRYEQLVTEVVTQKVDSALANQLEKANPEYARVIARARKRGPDKAWSVGA